MAKISRRQFLRSAAAAGVFVLGGRELFAQATTGSGDFNILVVGDSFIWNQGLQEKDKFYSLITESLRSGLVRDISNVNLKVKAHSGARIRLHPKQVEEMEKVGQETDRFYYPEADISFPSITTQVDTARQEYSDPSSVGLVMLSGGITDLVVGNAINPFLKKSKFLRMVHEYCHIEMQRLLEHTTDTFPNAKVLVFGYFPIVSTKSDVNKIMKYLMKIVRFPHELQWLITNDLSKQFMKIVRKTTSNRSRLWFARSNVELSEAIANVNARFPRPRVALVESPVTEESCFATKNSLLWSLDNDNLPEDDLYRERKTVCPTVFREIKYKPFGPLSVRLCELASVAHVNKAGSKAYATAALPTLRELLR